MRINNQGTTIYEEGDVVMLATERPGNWENNGDMDRYLSNVVTLTNVHYSHSNEHLSSLNGYFTFSGSENWSFRINDILCMATPELIEEHRLKKERELAEFKEKFKTFVLTSDEVCTIAKDIFGEEYVDVKTLSPTEFQLIILFPEVNITNSKAYKHVMKDLYVKINIDISIHNVTNGNRLSNIGLSGRRGKLSEEEYHSDYGHSHFSGRGIERWSDFCLGSSDFAMIIQTMRFSLTPEDWSLLFLSLDNYVSWESLEGGPYHRINSVSLRQESHNSSDFRNHALELIKTLPNACLTLNDGEIVLNTDHPALSEHYLTNSRIRSFRSDASGSFATTQVRFNSHVSRKCTSFTFKDQQVVPTLYEKDREASTELPNIDLDVIDFYNRTIIKELKHYKFRYEYNKISANSTFFRENSPFQ